MVSVSLLFSAVVATTLAATTEAIDIYFHNQCPYNIDLWFNDNGGTWGFLQTITPGNYRHSVNQVGPSRVWRHGASDQATLIEFSITDKVWYDISVVPPYAGNCVGFDACKASSGHVGYNVPVSMRPRSGANGANCRSLQCTAYNPSACADAYLFPSDTKTHDCPPGTAFDVYFCP